MARSKRKTNALVGVLWLLWTTSASGQSAQQVSDDCTSDPECNRHYMQAVTLSKAGQLAGALEEYQTAFALKPVPTLLFNIARINHKLGRLKEAASAYKAYLQQDTGTDPALKEKAREYLAQLSPQGESPQALPSQPDATRAYIPEPQPQSALTKPPPELPGTNVATVPVYKRWWLWTAVGAVVVGGTIALIVGTRVDFRPKPSEIIDLRSQL